MKRILIVKMSSMGDVLHTLPALTDAIRVYPHLTFDWVVEPSFVEIPLWHKAVRRVIQAPIRRFRKMPIQSYRAKEWHQLVKQLRYSEYDIVIDAQGLVKSTIIANFAKGKRFGLDWQSARDPISSLFYHHKIAVEKNQHAVERIRELFAKTFNYPLPLLAPDYGIDRSKLSDISYGDNTLIFLHGTTWPTKHWPESYWCLLAQIATRAGFNVLLPWGNESEKERANKIKNACLTKNTADKAIVLPKMSLSEITSLIAKAKGIVAVDTGLGHVAAAMATTTVSVYGPTSPMLTGAYGPKQYHLKVDASCSPCFSRECKRGSGFALMPPCFESLSPEKVWQNLINAMELTCSDIKENA